MMSLRRWGVLGLVAVALLLVQHAGLERQPEAREEQALREVGRLPAGEMVPTYVASLFFGAFRAIVIDVLWIQLKRIEEERRWYEARETLKMIGYFQPRNPEVWVHLGWNAAYNIANGFTDPEKSWEWVRFGLDWLRRGLRHLPSSVHLQFELAYTLMHKASWKESELDLALLRRIEQDAALQAALPPNDMPAASRPLSPFELAIPWLERARDTLFRLPEQRFKTQMGLYLYPTTMDGFLRKCLYLQGMYLWKQGRSEEAFEWIRRVESHTRLMITPGRYREFVSPLFEDYARFYALLPPVLQSVDEAEKSGRPEDLRAAVDKLQKLILPQPYGVDEGLLWHRYDGGAVLNRLKRRLTGGRDIWEANDSIQSASDLPLFRKAEADLSPPGLDEDWYWIHADQAADGPPEPGPRRLVMTVEPPRGFPLRLNLHDPHRRPMWTREIRETEAVSMTLDLPASGLYFLQVAPLDPAGPWPDDTRYTLLYDVQAPSKR